MRRSLWVSCIGLLVGAALGAPSGASPEPGTSSLPNLFAYPPSSLIGPVTGQITGSNLPGLDPFVVDGCLPEERAQGAGRCLRYATKITNFSLPHLEIALRAEPSGTNAYQVVPEPEGGVSYHPAGSFSVDPWRGEVQLDDFYVMRLWSVRGGLKTEVVAETPLRGLCPGHGLGYVPHGGCVATPARMGPEGPEKILRLAWLEEVRLTSDLPGQYIDVTGVLDGVYALEIEIDAEDHIAESQERDNATCVIVRLRGEQVTTMRSDLCRASRT